MGVGVSPLTDLEVVPVTDARGLRQFIDLPWSLYPPESLWVPPLKSDLERQLDVQRHPFWEHAERELFVAYREGRPVGRIAAIVDENYNRYHDERMGSWGFFECVNDQAVADALYRAAENWVRAKGMDFLRGPFNPSTNYEIGTLIDGYQYPPTVMMTYNPPYYAELAEGYGLTKEKDVVAMLIDRSTQSSQRMAKLAARIRSNNRITIRRGERRRFQAEMAIVKEIYEASWSNNWGFVPMSGNEVNDMGEKMLKIIDPDYVLFLNYQDEPAGICLMLPDINPLLKQLNGKIGLLGPVKWLIHRKKVRGLRAVLFGIKHEYQKIGLPIVLFDHLNQVLRAQTRYDYLELGWNLEDNNDINRFDVDAGGREYKRYRIYRKSF